MNDEIEQEVMDAAESPNELDMQVAELTADLQRVQAEFANYRRRMQEQLGELSAAVASKVAREFLTVRDSFDHELANRPAESEQVDAASVDAIRAQFDSVLKGLGVERFESAGKPFDPRLHEAVVSEGGEGEHEVVTADLQPGYMIGQQVLRPAMVKVGTRSE